MNQNNLYPVIIAGGSGSRLWPLSRTLYPKQFLCLDGEKTMLQATISRLNGLHCAPPLVICNEKHRFIAADQLAEIRQLTGNIILEPQGRNTAPAIALAAIAACNNNPDHNPLLLVLAADHIIEESKAFQDAITAAIPLAENGKLVTFGIVPDAPKQAMAIFAGVKSAVRNLKSTLLHLMLTPLSKNPIWKKPKSISPVVIITGTAVCFYSRRAVISKSWKNFARISCRPAWML